MNIIDLSKRHLLNETEHCILSSILDAVARQEAHIPIRTIAAQSFVSTTTVIKLAKKLGYQGYSDMIYSLKRHAAEERNPASCIDLPSILKYVDLSTIDLFAEEILHHSHACIFIVGLGFSTVASSYFVRRLATLGILAYDGAPVDMIRTNGQPSLTIMLSKSGETKDLLDIAAYARGRQHHVFTITAHEDSTLAQMSDAVLTVQTGSPVAYNVPDLYIGRTIILIEYILSQLITLLEEEPSSDI